MCNSQSSNHHAGISCAVFGQAKCMALANVEAHHLTDFTLQLFQKKKQQIPTQQLLLQYDMGS